MQPMGNQGVSNMKQDWFELRDIRQRNFSRSVWVPLRASQRIISEGVIGREGFKEEFFAAAAIAFPIEKKSKVEVLGWDDVGTSHSHRSCVQDGRYCPADIFEYWRQGELGINLVLEQSFNSRDVREWHIHQDVVLALRLKREGDTWVCPNEGYTEVVRLHRSNGSPVLLEIRAEFLKDYLCARNMSVYLSTFRNRVEVCSDASHITWPNGSLDEKNERDKLIGRKSEIHEGGMPYGAATHVMHVARTDVDVNEDVPSFGLPDNANLVSQSWTKKSQGKKLYRVEGKIWRTEFIEKADSSPRVREDDTPATVYFITDEKGKKESKETIDDTGRWLWFKPEVINSLTNRRGGSLKWYTKNTGQVECSPDCGVHFGVNGLGLVTVYAKDIALLDDWQQAIWAGYNIGPEGGVAVELHKAQIEARPADTQAPEKYLEKGLSKLNELAKIKLGKHVWRNHKDTDQLIKKTHRFRAVDEAGLYSLAKDLARLTAESFDTSAIQSIAPPPAGKKLGSLKSLENLLAVKADEETARAILGPLVGVNELRHADAHLASNDIDEAYKLLGIDKSLPYVHQGCQLIESCVAAIYSAIDVLKDLK